MSWGEGTRCREASEAGACSGWRPRGSGRPAEAAPDRMSVIMKPEERSGAVLLAVMAACSEDTGDRESWLVSGAGELGAVFTVPGDTAGDSVSDMAGLDTGYSEYSLFLGGTGAVMEAVSTVMVRTSLLWVQHDTKVAVSAARHQDTAPGPAPTNGPPAGTRAPHWGRARSLRGRRARHPASARHRHKEINARTRQQEQEPEQAARCDRLHHYHQRPLRTAALQSTLTIRQFGPAH